MAYLGRAAARHRAEGAARHQSRSFCPDGARQLRRVPRCRAPSHFPQKSPRIMALLRKMTFNLRHPMGLRHPVRIIRMVLSDVFGTPTHTRTHTHTHTHTHTRTNTHTHPPTHNISTRAAPPTIRMPLPDALVFIYCFRVRVLVCLCYCLCPCFSLCLCPCICLCLCFCLYLCLCLCLCLCLWLSVYACVECE